MDRWQHWGQLDGLEGLKMSRFRWTSNQEIVDWVFGIHHHMELGDNFDLRNYWVFFFLKVIPP